ncbi:MAG: hypothetical protein K0U47_05755 [Epsilonproteobacteria bacterium]|nr:hypothetical protein [Campylobacterota bacterium]
MLKLITFYFSIVYTTYALAQDQIDSQYLYQHQTVLEMQRFKSGKHETILVKDLKRDKILMNTDGLPLYKDNANQKLKISYEVIQKQGGFDIVYTVQNTSKKPQFLPDFQIPGIYLKSSDTLEVLNANTKLYMQHYEVPKLNSFIAVSALEKRNNFGQKEIYETYYAADTLSPYAPVIVAKDQNFAVGSSLNYPLLSYKNASSRRGKRDVKMDKLYPKMRIYKDDKYWRFHYSFAKEGKLKSQISAGNKFLFTVPVRFSSSQNWIFTLASYKYYLHQYYTSRRVSKKDVQPILGVNFAFYGDSITGKSPRGWAWALENIDQQGNSFIPLKEVSLGLSTMMQQKGYKRILFYTFSGVYNTLKNPLLDQELPFQILTNLEKNMQKEIASSLAIFSDRKQKYGFWWGIAGMMPVDKRGEVINNMQWLPYGEVPFNFYNSKHKQYAYRQLKKAKKYNVSTLTLDAYVRMEEKQRIRWLAEMQAYLPEIDFILEQQVDFMHIYAGIILQPENLLYDRDELEFQMLTQPPLLAHYLNPNQEVQVWLQQKAAGKDELKYIHNLVQWGYTPIVMMHDSDQFNHDEHNVTKRILDNTAEFISVKSLTNRNILACFDGKDNDADGKIDWPYDEECLVSWDQE